MQCLKNCSQPDLVGTWAGKTQTAEAGTMGLLVISLFHVPFSTWWVCSGNTSWLWLRTPKASVTQGHFHRIIFLEAVTRVHPVSRRGHRAYNSEWRNAKVLEDHVRWEVLFQPFFCKMQSATQNCNNSVGL